ncbi:MAG: D-alanyl-D-alanine carboxypeptidase/D-alanyl-D-alanine endopeptidase [Thermoanaerobaculia bacterium]
MISTRSRMLAAAVLAIFAATAAVPPADAATKKRRPKRTTKKVVRRAAPAVPTAVGNTFEERLSSLVNSSVAQNSTASIQVVEVETGRVAAQRNAALPVAPASNMKLFTTGAAIDLLRPEFEFKTTVAMRGTIDTTGVLRGDVKITGRGDPTIGGRFHDGRATAVIEQWANELKRAGVRAIAGDLLFEHGYFDSQYVHPTWPEDQLVNWYEAPIASLSMQEGCVLVRILPGRSGGLAVVQMEPPNTYLTIQNSCRTRGRNSIFVTRARGTNRIIVSGSVAPRSGPTEVYVTVLNPVHYFANVVHQTFVRSGIAVNGQVQLVGTDPRTDWQVVAEHRTPLSVVNYVINKKSQNHYAEQLLKAIGAESGKGGSFAGGVDAINEWLTGKVGVPPDQFQMTDGSGMSRFNRVSSGAFIELLRYMWQSPYRREFVSSMPYTGEPDSRLRRRLNQAPYARQVYAKTGYISGVIGLSGYVRAKSGKVYAFSFLFNGYKGGVWSVYSLQDAMLKEIVDRG